MATRRLAAAAAAMRMDGASEAETGALLGMGVREVRAAVEQHLAEQARKAAPRNREVLRRVEDERLERMMLAVWPRALDPDDPDQLPAVRAALSISERRSRLHGLDAPAEVVVHSPTLAEIDAWVAQVAGGGPAGPVEPDVVALQIAGQEQDVAAQA
jgi:hypothetical protein